MFRYVCQLKCLKMSISNVFQELDVGFGTSPDPIFNHIRFKSLIGGLIFYKCMTEVIARTCAWELQHFEKEMGVPRSSHL